MFPLFDSEMSREDSERLVKLLNEAQKRAYSTQARWEAMVRKVIGVLQDWFEALEEGTANHRYPSPHCTVSDEQANRLIEVVDSSFEKELSSYPEYWTQRKQVDGPPQFCRLELHARRALAEELKRLIDETEAGVARP